MKKFLGKLPVMLTFVIVAVLVLGVYIGLLARPVATGMTYSYTMDKDEVSKSEEMASITGGQDLKIFKKFDITISVKFKSSKVLAQKISVDYTYEKDVKDETKKAFDEGFKALEKTLLTETEISYYRDGNKIYVLGDDVLESKEYDEAVKMLKESEDWQKMNSFTVNAFALKTAEEGFVTTKSLTCTGTIVLAVVLGVVEVALIAFSALSVAAFVGSKKKQA